MSGASDKAGSEVLPSLKWVTGRSQLVPACKMLMAGLLPLGEREVRPEW